MANVKEIDLDDSMDSAEEASKESNLDPSQKVKRLPFNLK